MTRVYYKEAVGAFIVFDISRGSTFDAVLKWKSDHVTSIQYLYINLRVNPTYLMCPMKLSGQPPLCSSFLTTSEPPLSWNVSIPTPCPLDWFLPILQSSALTSFAFL